MAIECTLTHIEFFGLWQDKVVLIEPGAPDRLTHFVPRARLCDQDAVWIKQKPQLDLAELLIIIRNFINGLLGVDRSYQAAFYHDSDLLDKFLDAPLLDFDLSLVVGHLAKVFSTGDLLNEGCELDDFFSRS